MYEIGSFTAFPFIGPALDTFGRKFGLLIGISILFMGTVVQGTAATTASVGQFMGGRFLLGFGIAIAASAGPTVRNFRTFSLSLLIRASIGTYHGSGQACSHIKSYSRLEMLTP